MAAALALTRQGFAVKVLEQAPQLGEIGAGMGCTPERFYDALEWLYGWKMDSCLAV